MGKDTEYAKKLKSPEWLFKRGEILMRDNYTCQSCGDQSRVMHVHHKYYLPEREPWEYPNEVLITLCEICHMVEEIDRKNAFADLNKAIATSGFTREDVQKLTSVFKEISVKPMYSYLLMSKIYRAVNDAFENFDEPIFTPITEDNF